MYFPKQQDRVRTVDGNRTGTVIMVPFGRSNRDFYRVRMDDMPGHDGQLWRASELVQENAA